MYGQSCRDLFERSVTLSLAEKVEPKSRQALSIEEPGQGLVGCAVLAGEKSMAQQGETRCRFVGRAQDGSNAMAEAIMKCQGFFQEVVFQSSINLTAGTSITAPVAQQKKPLYDIRSR